MSKLPPHTNAGPEPDCYDVPLAYYAGPEDEPDDDNLVDQDDACPCCGERDADELVWDDDDYVTCQTCGKEYQP